MRGMEEGVIKVDREGRKSYSAEYKSKMLAAYQSSGMSRPEFCRHHGLSYMTFVSWMENCGMKGTSKAVGSKPKKKGKLQLCEVSVGSVSSTSPIQLRLRSGHEFSLPGELLDQLPAFIAQLEKHHADAGQ